MSGDATSLDSKPSHEGRSAGIIGRITGAVGAMIPGKARQKDERSVGKQRRPPTPKSHEPAGKLQEQTKHQVSKPQEQDPGPQTKQKQESDRPLESRRIIEENAKQEAARLRDQLHRVQAEAKQETGTLLDQVHNLQTKSKQDARKLQQMSMDAENMKNVVCALRDDLEKANTRVAALEKTAAENEAIITQANATAVSKLASNVSRGFTDDMIREALKKFFQTDFFSWCADLCTEQIKTEDTAVASHQLLHTGITNSSPKYLNSAEYLKFHPDMPDGSGPLMLLQAALATRLCGLYLSDAFFLAEELPSSHEGRVKLYQFERHFGRAQPDEAINWRIQTVECLEKSIFMTEEILKREADRFVKDYFFLLSLEKYDPEASKDLVQIFADFATLALKLWKSRTHVGWCNTVGFGETAFELGNPWVEVESSLASRMGQRLNGRPIGLIIRPMIVSRTLAKDGKWQEVIWLKALAWVSGEDDPEDLMALI
ncbi:hypothetical protein CCMA1212_001855 [Trichoderma ghanense]|uniref:Uncharacterized protein n=1 Tax=Trichoderma ghanense TaxID=65468 RepID=A0ABY2HDH1_9HYPO